MDKILEQLGTIFDAAGIAGWIVEVIPRAVAVLVLIVVFYVAWRVIKASLAFVLAKADVDKTIASFINSATAYTVATIAVLASLSQLGIDTASIIASLGVVGLTIGFAAKDALSNVMSGLFIFWDRPFTVDDLVEINGVYGRVELITLRSTRVVTPDGRMLAFPNTTVANNMVVSYTNFPGLRLDVEVTVAVTEDIDNVRAVLLKMAEEHPIYMDAPAPQVKVKALNDYNVLLEVRAWIADEREHIMRRFELRELIFKALNNAGVEMPYETYQLAPFTATMRTQKDDEEKKAA